MGGGKVKVIHMREVNKMKLGEVWMGRRACCISRSDGSVHRKAILCPYAVLHIIHKPQASILLFFHLSTEENQPTASWLFKKTPHLSVHCDKLPELLRHPVQVIQGVVPDERHVDAPIRVEGLVVEHERDVVRPGRKPQRVLEGRILDDVGTEETGLRVDPTACHAREQAQGSREGEINS